jgi:hypothetical protein
MAKKITAFTPANLDALRVEIQEALNAIAAKHGIVAARLGRIGYAADHFKANIQFGTAEGSSGEEIIDPKLHDNMKRHGHKIGFSVDDIGKSIVLRELGSVKIVGMFGYTKVAVQATDGKLYRVHPQSARLAYIAAKK